MLAEPAAAQLVNLLLEDEGARGGELVDEIILPEMEGKDLPPDGRRRLKIIDDLEAIFGPGQRGDRGIFIVYLDRLADHHRVKRRIPLRDARLLARRGQ